jgi:hemolysin activation/secretion protein
MTSITYAEPVKNIGRVLKSQTIEEVEFPEFTEETGPEVDVQLPEPDLDEKSDQLSTKLVVFLKQLIIQGNSVLTEDEIEAHVTPLVGRKVSMDELQRLRQELSMSYLKKGYVNSGVIIPDQKVVDGVITFRAIEGKLSDVDLSGNQRIYDAYIRDRIKRSVGEPLNVFELQDSLRLLQENRLIERINAQLKPGVGLGESIVKVDIKEARPYTLHLGADNQQSPSVGSRRGVLEFEQINLTGWGDRLILGGSHSNGVDSGHISYRFPLNANDTAITAYYSTGETIVVEEPFIDIDIESETDRGGLSLSHPLINNLDQQWDVSMGLEISRSETSLAGRPFSFSMGAKDGKSNATVINLSSEWVIRSSDQVFAVRGTWRKGIDAYKATIRDGDEEKYDRLTGVEQPDGEFNSFISQLQYGRRIPFHQSQLKIKLVYQQALDPLLAVEKFVVGGMNTVRGYRENQFVRDSGIAGSIEWHVPLWVDENGIDRGKIKIVPFFDYGRSWDEDNMLASSHATTIRGVGFGLSWYPSDWFKASVYYGDALDSDEVPDQADDDLQDKGIHYTATLSWPF